MPFAAASSFQAPEGSKGPSDQKPWTPTALAREMFLLADTGELFKQCYPSPMLIYLLGSPARRPGALNSIGAGPEQCCCHPIEGSSAQIHNHPALLPCQEKGDTCACFCSSETVGSVLGVFFLGGRG